MPSSLRRLAIRMSILTFAALNNLIKLLLTTALFNPLASMDLILFKLRVKE